MACTKPSRFNENMCLPCPSDICANEDIAGQGALIPFIATAALTFITTVGCLLLTRNSSEDTINPIDKRARRLLCGPAQRVLGPQSSDIWAGVLYDVVLSFSDQQIVTGIAVLVSAVVNFHKGIITVYHFTLATDLAWFSSNTHLLCLIVIRSFDETAKIDHKAEFLNIRDLPETEPIKPHETVPMVPRMHSLRIIRIIRVSLMVLLAALLVYCTWITGYEDWDKSLACFAKCKIHSRQSGMPRTWEVSNFAVIFYLYPPLIFQIFPIGREFWLEQVRDRLTNWDREWFRPLLRKNLLANCIYTGGYIPFTYLWYFLASETIRVAQLICWFAMGVYWLMIDRKAGRKQMSEDEIRKEDAIGFGQLVSLLLLLIPLLTLIESHHAHTTRIYADRTEKGEHVKTIPRRLN